jgi:16S rRNA (cytidine1402-2'-O)-methyltransferase
MLSVAGSTHAKQPIQPALYVVATPIGNLQDISARALTTLLSCSVLMCEDTRVTKHLLQYGLDKVALPEIRGVGSGVAWRDKTYIVCNAHTEEASISSACDFISNGKAVAYVSDAGTPAISDPGFKLVAGVRAAGFPVVAVPGPCSVSTALSVSGVNTSNGYRFFGFIPHDGDSRTASLLGVHHHLRTHATVPAVLFEAPHRIKQTLQELSILLSTTGVQITICRELTKIHEEVRVFPSVAAAAEYWKGVEVRGEFVLILHTITPPDSSASTDTAAHSSSSLEDARELVHELLRVGVSPSAAVQHVSKMTQTSRKSLYRLILADTEALKPQK